MKKQTIKIYHNPRCSKSRATVELVEKRLATRHNDNLELEIIRYLETPPDRTTLSQLLALLQCPVQDIVRSGDPLYREVGLDKQSSDEELLDSLEANPALLQRPIVVLGDKAVIGRPPENVLSIL